VKHGTHIPWSPGEQIGCGMVLGKAFRHALEFLSLKPAGQSFEPPVTQDIVELLVALLQKTAISGEFRGRRSIYTAQNHRFAGSKVEIEAGAARAFCISLHPHFP